MRRGDIAQLEVAREEAAVAGDEADAQPRQVRPLRQRLELDDVGEVGAGCFEDAGRRLSGIDLGIALVAEHQESESARQRDHALEIGQVGDGALRICRRGQEEGDRAGQQFLGKRIEIGQETGGLGGRQIDRLTIGRHGPGRIRGIERIGDQHCRTDGAPLRLAASSPTRRRDRGQEQALARAVEHQHFGGGVDRPRQCESAPEPGGGGLAERVEALVHGIAAEFIEMRGDDGPHEGRDAVSGLAYRQADGGLARRRIAQELAQAHEGRTAGIGAGG